MRDSEGRLLGAVTTLEDVTSLQDTDRFKTQFITVASRKLRDPLLQLRRGLYALAQGFSGEMTPLQTELVASASKDAENLNDLMSDLIDVAEIDTGKREMKLERIRPLQALNEARDRYCDEAQKKHIRVEVKAYADLAMVLADRRALRSILDNLLSNALRYTPEDGEILLAAEEIKNFVQFSVRDTGRGIEAERLSAIFDRFNPFSEKGSGLGPGAGAAAGGVAGRANCRGEPAGPRNDIPIHASGGCGCGSPSSRRGGLDGRPDVRCRNRCPKMQVLRLVPVRRGSLRMTSHLRCEFAT